MISLSRRQALRALCGAAAGAALAACREVPAPGAGLTEAPGPVTDPGEALRRLMEGNQRWVSFARTHPNQTRERREAGAQGQQPFASVAGCIDSRVAPEMVFDRGIGDLLVARTAGQVIDKAVLGSLEYGAEELHIPLIMVLGHEKCGAVAATIDVIEKNASVPEGIATLVNAIKPAVEQAHGQPGDLLKNSVIANVKLEVASLKASKPVLADLVDRGKLRIVGGYYNLGTGVVDLVVT